MTSTKRIALVTGANRGIGFEICRQLAQRGLHVVLGSRDASKGRAATEVLRKEGLEVETRTLDVTSARSINALAAWIGKSHGRLDVLVNNAGIMIDPRGTRFLDSRLETYHDTLKTNLFGPLLLCQALAPLMKKNGYGRIVNVSSGQGQLADMSTGTPAYRISKTALNALTCIIAAEFKTANILVNSMCPGWVKTDMGGPSAPRTPRRGAATAVWLAMLPDGGPSGGFFRDQKRILW